MINFRYSDSGEIKIEFFCDSCHQKIKSFKDGLIIFDKTINNKLNNYQLVHHGECADFENKDEIYMGSEELINIKKSLIELMESDLNKDDVKRIFGKMPN